MIELTYALLAIQGVVAGLNITSKTVILNTTQDLLYLRVPYALQCNGTPIWNLLKVGEMIEVEGFQTPYGLFRVTKVKVGDLVCAFSKGRGTGQGVQQGTQKGMAKGRGVNPLRSPAR